MPSIDNLYLDMNGIVHVCTHSNDKKVSAQESEKYQMQKIFSYIDKMFQMVKPTQYFYMAIDGVAPRAKMNQQRQRRFRSAFEADKAKKELIKNGEPVPEETFNSNCITPGTPFMEKLSRHLQYFIAHKIETDVRWQQCKIVYSGHDVPGEGEHKIMDFVRKRKMASNYNPNEKHVLYGLDADLIMLGLVTHEPHFMLLREDVFEQFNYRKGEEQNKPLQKNFQLLHLSILREYFNLEFRNLWNDKKGKKFGDYNLERIIDDFVFICFFCGNDFLPHSPTLDIGEGAIGLLFEIYQDVLLEVGYLTEETEIKFDKVNVFCQKIADREEEILLERYQNLKKEKKEKRRVGIENFKASIARMESFMPDQSKVRSVQRAEVRTNAVQYNVTQNIFAEMSDELDIEEEIERQNTLLQGDHIEPLTALSMSAEGSQEEEMVDIIEHEDMSDADEEETRQRDAELFKGVKGSKFDFKGWRGAYYQEKLHIDYSDKESITKLVTSYIEGLKWNYHYYYNGCVSWGWYYPYSYAPLMTDIADSAMEEIANSIEFKLGTPFFPFQQLLGVLPPSSAELLPEVYRPLMTAANSPIADMYPATFKIDREGTRYEYEGVVILPFIDEDRLIAAEKTLDLSKLTPAQKHQNVLGQPQLYQHDENGQLSVNALLSDMPSVANAPIKVQDYKDPSDKKFIPRLCPGVKFGIEGPEGFPSLSTLQIDAKMRNVGTTILGRPSKKPSMCVIMKDVVVQKFQTAEEALYLLGKQVYIGYPMPQPAIISSVADIDKSYYGNGSNREDHTSFEQEQFQKEVQHHQSLLFGRYALDIGEVRVLVYCRLFKGMMKSITGDTVRKFSKRDSEYAYPAQLIIHNYTPIHDPRFQQRRFELQDEYKTGTEVICLNKDFYGCKATVTQTILPYTVELDVIVPPTDNIDFPPELTEAADLQYYSIQQLSRSLRLPDGRNPSPKCLGILTTGFKVNAHQGNKRFHFGLKMRHVGKGQILLHYARCKLDEQKTEQNYFLNFGAGNQQIKSSKFSAGNAFDWEYSEKAIVLLQEYIDRFPEIFYGVESCSSRISTSSDVLSGQTEDPDTFMDAVDEWIVSLELSKKPFISATNNYLDQEHLCTVESAIIDYYATKKNAPFTQTDHTQLTAKQVYKPPNPAYKGMIDENALDIGHRVVHIHKEGQVPFGLRGVVVGIENDNAQVIFDEEFLGGSTFSDILKTNRGQIVPKLALLNLSKPRYAGTQSFAGSHFSVEKSKTFQERTPYNSSHYYNVARKPPQGVIDISDVKNEKKQKQRQIQKHSRKNDYVRKPVAQIRREAGAPSSGHNRSQYNPDDLAGKASSIVERYNGTDFVQQSQWFKSLSQFSAAQQLSSIHGYSGSPQQPHRQKNQEEKAKPHRNGGKSPQSAQEDGHRNRDRSHQRRPQQQVVPQQEASTQPAPQEQQQAGDFNPAASFKNMYSSQKGAGKRPPRQRKKKDTTQEQEKEGKPRKERKERKERKPRSADKKDASEKQDSGRPHKEGKSRKSKKARRQKSPKKNGKSDGKSKEVESLKAVDNVTKIEESNGHTEAEPHQQPQQNANGGFQFFIPSFPIPPHGMPPQPFQFPQYPMPPQGVPQQQPFMFVPPQQQQQQMAQQSAQAAPRRRSNLVPSQAVKAGGSQKPREGGNNQEQKSGNKTEHMLSEADILEEIKK
eukprot:CAMPEP_0117443702 /NCGR_PEP_ID=MMETSP0759-20121206/4838_1 /TAXON_ID=63605 /ORGANISM="Percolomonas cosmopolitus, Strain WS" /LENGTH=1679 /DNA_ID=CAMNT_0005235699 /DNA_START=331 /DNA_END=5370 /DNA_ORIENTATION=+